MKNKLLYLAIVLFQLLILIFFVEMKGRTPDKSKPILLRTTSADLKEIIKDNCLEFSYDISRLSAQTLAYEPFPYEKNQKVYVKLKQGPKYWEPTYFSTHRPEVNENEVIIKGTIDEAEKMNLYVFQYSKNGQVFKVPYIGHVSGEVTVEGKALLSLNPENPEQIQTASGYMTYANKERGMLLNVQKVAGERYTYEFTIQFLADGKQQIARYTSLFYSEKDVPEVGSPVELSFVPDKGGYRITYVDFNPLWEATVAEIKEAYKLKVNYGIERYSLQKRQKQQLTDLVGKVSGSEVGVTVVVTNDGRAVITGLELGEHHISLQ